MLICFTVLSLFLLFINNFFQTVKCHHINVKRQLLLPQFVIGPPEQQKMMAIVMEQQQKQLEQNRKVWSNKLPPSANKFVLRRPCYFSPVQCLLVTPGQHSAFENHPKFNDHVRPSADAVRHRHSLDSIGGTQHEEQQRVHHPHRHHRRHRLNSAGSNGAGGTRRQPIFGKPWRIGL
ncbi:hypothetical protein GPALN_002990 [Globodera pallida]|nr:hypothetical protein GPALN_002990 [Globodera pallida]